MLHHSIKFCVHANGFVNFVSERIERKVDMNVQFVQRIIFNYRKTFFNERRVSNLAILRLERPFLNNKIEVEVLFIAGLDHFNYLCRPNIKYNLNDRWQFKIGVDVFAGAPATSFGYYRNQSRYYFEIIYKF